MITMLDLKYFFHTNSFKSMLIDTKKYRELYKPNEAKLAVFLALMFTIIMFFLKDSIDDSEMTNLLKNIFSILISGLIGLLGFLVTGLAMMASIITKKSVENIDSLGKTKSLAGILFSFYFEGAMVGFNIIVMLATYIVLTFPIEIMDDVLILSTAIIAYSFFFTILYAVTLLGSCINFFFVNVCYDYELEEESKS